MRDSWFWDNIIMGVVNKGKIDSAILVLILALIYSSLLTYKALKPEGVYYNFFLFNILKQGDENFADYIKRQLNIHGLSIFVFFGFFFSLLILSATIMELINLLYNAVFHNRVKNIMEAIISIMVISVLAATFNYILNKQLPSSNDR